MLIHRSSCPEVFCKKGVQDLTWCLVLDKVWSFECAILLRKTLAHLLSCDFWEIIKDLRFSFFKEHLCATASKCNVTLKELLSLIFDKLQEVTQNPWEYLKRQGFPQVLRTCGDCAKIWWSWLESIHGGACGRLKTLLKNTSQGVHLLVKLSAISLQVCKFTKNELLHIYFSRILATISQKNIGTNLLPPFNQCFQLPKHVQFLIFSHSLLSQHWFRREWGFKIFAFDIAEVFLVVSLYFLTDFRL